MHDVSFGRAAAALVGCAVAVVLACGSAAAQRTLIVDRTGGPGAFADIPPAVAAAGAGDTIVVRNGAYSGVTTGKDLKMLFEPSGSVRAGETFHIAGVRAGSTFVLTGLTFEHGKTGWLRLTDCGGRVHLERVDVRSATQFFPYKPRPGIWIVACRSVSMTRCRAVGRPGVYCHLSTLVLTDCQLTGKNLEPSAPFDVPPAPGLHTVDSRVTVAGGTYQGGMPGAAGIYSQIARQGSSLFLTGDASTRVAAGPPGSDSTGPAVRLFLASMVHDPAVTLVPNPGEPKIAQWPGNPPPVARHLPALVARGAPPGGTVRAELVARPGMTAALMVSLPAFDVPTGYGDMWLDLAAHIVVDVGTVDASGRRRTAIPVPAAVARGIPLVLQSAVGPGVIRQLSTPAVVVLD